MKIGVFDSGVGGLSVARAIQKALPDEEILLREDKEHVPYGTRSPEELLGLVTPIFKAMVDDGCRIIVVACNTVSTTIIGQLREQFDIPLIAVEPMIKPAAEITKTGVITICATPTTLASPRYAWLKETYAKGLTVFEPDCAEWPAMIEHNQIDDQKITDTIKEALNRNSDVIVLGCTHYHWIEDKIAKLVEGKAQVIQPEPAIIRQLKRVIERLA
jgi:glutamate racemase